MEILLYISAVVATLAILLIALFIVITLKSAKQTMGEVSETLKRVEKKVGGVTEKADRLIDRTNHIAEDAEHKLQAFDSLAKTAKDLENATIHLDSSFKDVANQVSNPPEKHRKIMEQASVVTETIARIYFSFKRESNKQDSTKSKPTHKQLPAPQKKLEHRD